MSFGELVFLGLVIFAFTAFGVTLATVTWYERAGAASRNAKGRRRQLERSEKEMHRAA